ncbi:MAG: GNAT family N-acetyltransferase [Planctomycetota bacterium]
MASIDITRIGTTTDTPADAGGFAPRPLPAALRFSAAERLVEDSGPSARSQARQIAASLAAPAAAPDLAWATVGPAGRTVREVAVAFLTPGRSAVLVASRPVSADDERIDERAACIRATCEHLAGLPGQPVGIVQSLPATEEIWAVQSLEAAGWQVVGELAYLRRPIVLPDFLEESGAAGAELPRGVELEPVRATDATDDELRRVLEGLERSYEDTMDCPGLCGLRSTADILASHAAIGDPALAIWRVVAAGGRPEGAMLLAGLADQRCYELVYVGVSPALRQRGLGSALLRRALGTLANRLGPAAARRWSLRCAVDVANLPATRLYQRLGFRAFDYRVACVMPLEARGAD